ncbi:MAG: c-type cytochrome [Anaerolineales bacterium]|nr:c-type cytochrome [Anaerolineales bacterium]
MKQLAPGGLMGWGLFVALLALLLLTAAPAQGLPAGQTTPTPTSPAPSPSPTIDRLAAPPTVAAPTQADDGAQLYWLWCQPCHGDQGQGLTDEWRAQYPQEERNCWASGCHGAQPYEDGFTLPRAVPAIVGTDSLLRFATVGDLYEYIRVTMPYEYPAVLSDEEYLAVAAFLAQAHEVWDGVPLDGLRAHELPLRQAEPAVTPPPAEMAPAIPANGRSTILAGSVITMFLILGGVALWRQMRQ